MPIMNELPAGYRAFAPTMEDIPRAVEFFNLVEISEWGVPDFEESDVVEEWEEYDLEKSVVLVEDGNGDLVASMTLVNTSKATWEAYGYVHPDHQARGLGTWVTRWSEDKAAERADETEDGYQIVILNFISTINDPAGRLLNGLGYEGSKVFRRMRIDLEARPEPVIWPSGLQLHEFVENQDEHDYFDAILVTFADHWAAAPRTYEKWESGMKTGDYDPTLWLQLFDGDKIIGIAAGKVTPDGGWIPNVGVLPEYRRRGLAKRLLQELFIRYWDKGITRVELGVDAENRNSAIDLYLGAGMRQTHSYEANRKILREGLDWRDEDEEDE